MRITPSKLSGKIVAPASKSESIRAIYFASLAKGESKIENLLPSPDTKAMIRAMQAFGVSFHGDLYVNGGQLKPPDKPIDAGNSGLVLRFAAALSACFPDVATITGDHSFTNLRPSGELINGLNQLGACSTGSFVPLKIGGPMVGGRAKLNGRDSQPVSALLMAAPFASHPTEIEVDEAREKPWIDLTLSWLDRAEIPYQRDGYSWFRVEGNAKVKPFSYRVPADLSSIAFPIAAALVTKSTLVIEGVDLSEPQGDKHFIEIAKNMGALIDHDDDSLFVDGSRSLNGLDIDVSPCIDALPILSVLCAYANGTSRIYNGAIARNKESDRIHSMRVELEKMNVDIIEAQDGLIIRGGTVYGAHVCSHFDHRVSMSLIVAALGAAHESIVEGSSCIEKTYPTFVKDLKSVGANIDEHSAVRL